MQETAIVIEAVDGGGYIGSYGVPMGVLVVGFSGLWAAGGDPWWAVSGAH